MLSSLAAYIADVFQLKGDEYLLDLGCGEAELTNALASRVAAISGIDQDDAALANAHPTSNVTLVKGSIDALPQLLSGQANHALAYNVFQYLQTPDEARRAFRAVYGSIQPKGFFYVGAILDQATFQAFKHQWETVLNKQPNPGQIGRSWPADQLHDLALAAGFRAAAMLRQPGTIQLPYRYDYLWQKVDQG